jgi:ABC-type sugar transport system ATPase subunit
MVFQSYALYPHKTVRQNLAFGLQVRRLDASTIASRVRTTAEALGIGSLLDRKPAQLSGGQRQRVALGRAMVREPKAFLLDEPLSNLDPTLRVATRAELAMLHRRLGATMVYVTHDQEEAMTLGNRIAVMRDGALEQLGPAIDLFRRPANVFVATFIGSPAMNLWRGRSRRTSDGWQFVTTARSIALGDVDASIRNEADVLLGVRPHDIDIVDRDRSDASGRVEIVEPLGPVTVAHVRIEWADDLVRIVASADTKIAADDEVSFRIRRDRLHVFDAASGRRLAS